MADVTVAQFAEVLKVPVDKLLSQLDEAGIKVKASGFGRIDFDVTDQHGSRIRSSRNYEQQQQHQSK